MSDDGNVDILLTQTSNTPYTHLEINNKSYKAIIDLGFTHIFKVSKDMELANELLSKYKFVETQEIDMR